MLAIVIVTIPIIISNIIILFSSTFLYIINNDIIREEKIRDIAIKKFIEIGLIKLEKSNFNIDLKSLVIPQVLHRISKFSL